MRKLKDLIKESKFHEKKILSVAVAEDKEVLISVFKAIDLGIIDAILVGDLNSIKEIAKEENLNLKKVKIVDENNKKIAIKKAVKLVENNEADFIMKGIISTSDLLKEILSQKSDFKKNKLLSHIMIYDIPTYHKLLLLTDGGMIPYPDLQQKILIVQNAVELAKNLGIQKPKVAAICAVEAINKNMQSTLDAAALSQMNKRGQIKNCIIEGPLGLDNAISKEAAKHKNINTVVAGDADILLVPNIESGNFLGKSITYFAKSYSAGIVVGAKYPIVLVSRADTVKSKLYSIALGAINCR